MKKYKASAVSALIGIVFLGGIFYLARSENKAPAPASGSLGQLVASETEFDFGSISMKDGKVSHAYKVRNTGTDPVVISRMYTSCMCTTVELETKEGRIGPVGMAGHGLIPKINRTIAPGEEATVYAVFDPAAHGPAGVGLVNRVVYLESGNSALELGFLAKVTP